MELLKQPYEISVWRDVQVWHRRKLQKISVSEAGYERGKYYTLNPSQSTAVYELNFEAFNPDIDYYTLMPKITNGKINFKEGTIEEINLTSEDEESWYEKKDGKTVLVPQTIFSFFKEEKLCIIGSNSMDSPARCVNPKFTQKINGENTLTFTLYYQYVDFLTGKREYNPFVEFLANERKIKLRLGAPDDPDLAWYDFIIKSRQENSETKAFTYTCKDQFINELSKSGFDIELDNDLGNNMGTVEFLAENIMSGSDWEVGESDNLKQYKQEPLYEVTVGQGTPQSWFIAENIENSNEKIDIAKDLLSRKLYVFYSDIVEKKPQWQFLYLKKDGETSFKINDDLVIDRKYSNYIINVTYDKTTGWPSFVEDKWVTNNITGETNRVYSVELSHKYRGEKLIRQYQTEYDPIMDKYVGVYKKEGKLYYGYTESEYSSSGIINNYISNPNVFKDTSGWIPDKNITDIKIHMEPNTSNPGEFHSFIHFKNNSSKQSWIRVSGVGSSASQIESFAKGEKYVVRLKYKTDPISSDYCTDAPNIKIAEWEYLKEEYNFSNGITYFNFTKMSDPQTNDIDSNGEYIKQTGYIYMLAECSTALSESSFDNKNLELFLSFGQNSSDYYIEDLQLFPYKTYVENNKTYLCVPEGKIRAEVKTKYIYYKKNAGWKSKDQFEAEYSQYENDPNFVQQYKTGKSQFTKVRSIQAKESNRFNLIQTLCETFECWPIFTIEREQSGEISLDENYRQKKYLSFKETKEQPNFVGFRYGVNSKSIQRTIDSASVISKLIVKDNANEFAPGGFCSISRASENPNKENFIFNFDYYVRSNLLNFNEVNNDLYQTVNGSLGYYQKLKTINADRDEKIEIQAGLIADIAKCESNYTTFKTSYESAVEEQLEIVINTKQYLGNSKLTNDNFYTTVKSLLESSYKDDSTLISYYTKWCQCSTIKTQHKPKYEISERSLNDAQKDYDDITAYLENIANSKRELNLSFYKKYSRFIQEGSWIKEDYIDPNLYYLDAESTLHTSTQPKVTYNINVIDVSQLTGLEYYKFKLGDKTYIEDVEFFGWSMANSETPYREEILVSEITFELDAPEKNQIKVQNYKTQFEDLFQRITASTQQAEFHTGEYNRATSIIEPDGTISPMTLESSFANNSLTLSNTRDQSVTWNEYGITTTSLSRPSEMVRIVSGGIFLSKDGGSTWKTGITGSGINTSYLTSGQISTNEICIMNGKNAAFRWDKNGLASYSKFNDLGKENDNYNQDKFIRFDHNGIYGIIGSEEWDGTDEEIHTNASFALTWSGFSLKNNDGSLRISTEDDIQVKDKEGKERIKIGRLDKAGNITYGIRITDGNNTVMETDDSGQLWLRDLLHVGIDTTSKVEIGYSNDRVRNGTNKHEVIRAGDVSSNNNDAPFIVYEDGYVVANKIEIKGGTVGNLNVESIENLEYEVLISSNKGMVVTEDSAVTLTAEIYKGNQVYEIADNQSVSYQWYLNSNIIYNETNSSLEIPNIQFGDDSFKRYSCKVIISTKEE